MCFLAEDFPEFEVFFLPPLIYFKGTSSATGFPWCVTLENLFLGYVHFVNLASVPKFNLVQILWFIMIVGTS